MLRNAKAWICSSCYCHWMGVTLSRINLFFLKYYVDIICKVCTRTVRNCLVGKRKIFKKSYFDMLSWVWCTKAYIFYLFIYVRARPSLFILTLYQIKTKYFFIRHMAKENIVKHNSSDDDFSFIALKLAGSVQRHLTTAIISYIKRETNSRIASSPSRAL